ncbi:hypothetical protein [Pararhizobium sp.]|uniref:hypothetical protein n=1 Tax=Pararhizobium sp. TaxID=1977563 RepID=UPI00271A677D|nr:hypothetical protein [Pararhizobium sp.]MDO9418029.1 hypothetical protein [Pararhizobium sp.]
MMARFAMDARAPKLWERQSVRLGLFLLTAAAAVAAFVMGVGRAGSTEEAKMAPPPPGDTRTELGINLFGLATYNRGQVYLNLITQSEWFSSYGEGWTAMSKDQLDQNGWVRELKPGQTAPRPFVIPPAPFRTVQVRCEYRGRGEISAGGVASIQSSGDGWLMLILAPTGAEGESGWIELVRTDASNPVRDIDCRDVAFPRTERFHPEFLKFVKNFKVVRFLDWQRTNDNVEARWADRARPESSSQITSVGASIEDMIDVANRTEADPWFLIPYKADDQYIREFARLVHDKLDPDRTVYVELGNEVWNDMFDASQQAQREGLMMKLGNGDPTRAKMIRYAQKVRTAMKIWTGVYADRPERLVRVAASQHAWSDLANIILDDADTAQWVDALATAPYIWFDLNGLGGSDVDRIFAGMPAAIERTMKFVDENRAIAAKHKKRFIAYEGGQHLVTSDLTLARAIQRDPRMADVYERYLAEWDKRARSTLTLYASTAPIDQYGSWGLVEYAGQPLDQAPKLRAVKQFQARIR